LTKCYETAKLMPESEGTIRKYEKNTKIKLTDEYELNLKLQNFGRE